MFDAKASESLDGILTLQGHGWLKRKSAAAFSQSQQVTVGPQGKLSIVTTTGPVSTVVKGHLAQEGDDTEAKAAASDAETKDESDVQLVECTDEECENEMIRVVVAFKGGNMVVTHALKKGDVNVKITRMTFERQDGQTATALRVFRRK